MIKARPFVLIGACASGVELAAALVGLGFGSVGMLSLAGALHVLAAVLALKAARLRRPDLPAVERDLVVITSLLVPIFGPALAWSMPHAEAPEKIEDAHQVFERYAKHVEPAAPDYTRTLFTGNYEKDLARELDAESHYEVLRHGSTDQKRNAFRKLADLGEPKHFHLIRRCLLDPEHEVRLYAYAELERCGRVYEEEIARCSRQLKGDENDGDTLLMMAQAYFDYAASGVHDEEMAAFYFRSAERFATRASASPEAAWLRAAALARLMEYDEADAVLEALGPQEAALARSCLARADLAFRRRDFAVARAEAERIRDTGEELPDWLAALEGKR